MFIYSVKSHSAHHSGDTSELFSLSEEAINKQPIDVSKHQRLLIKKETE